MLRKLTLFGCASVLLSMVKADPFKNFAESRGKIETGYGENDADFMKHRTRYHFLNPVNWMNDPSAPYYDGEYYHLYYQHNPFDFIWGNMTWGHARSKDLLKWEDRQFSLYPDTPEDQAGAFDGTVLLDKGYQGYPTLIYTAVNRLNTPYEPGAEQQMLTITKDNGDTWVDKQLVVDKSDIPFDLPVNGFRDPYLFRSTTFDELLNLKPNNEEDDSIYMTISSSVVKQGGRLWLYHSKNWLDWEFRGPILSHPVNYTSNPTYFGSDGDNFEVASYFELSDPAGGDNFHVLSYGSERGRDDHFLHWTLFTAGQELEIIQPDNVEVAQPTPRLKETISGVVDWGLLYAVLEFKDPKNNDRSLNIGWVQDDLLNPKNNPARWNGVMGLYREAFIQKIDHVAPNDPILAKGKGAWIYDEQTRSVRLMGTRPMPDYEQIRGEKWSLDCNSNKQNDFSNYKIPVDSKYIEIDATFKIKSEDAGALGVVVRQSDTEETVINYVHKEGHIYINRTLSTQQTDLYRTTPEIAPFPLFQINAPNSDQSQAPPKYEDLHLRIFVDNSMLEVFANDRLAVSTRIYPDPNANGLSIRIPNEDFSVSNFDVYTIDFVAFDRP
ncbi:glycosyl hydrolase [Cunninghamella echinulata]|nr:glycosyl hydrolase [Cunninghamella echinulata]